VSGAVQRLEAAILYAPIEELRAPIENELGLNKRVDLDKLHDSLEHLKDRARLGHRESVETLIWLSSEIASFLSDIVQSANRKEAAQIFFCKRF